jgi:putative redox protein
MELLIDFPDGSRVDKHFGSFTVQTDQPPVASAPAPSDVILSSIGTCAGIYMPGFCHAGISPCWNFTSNAAYPRTADRS